MLVIEVIFVMCSLVVAVFLFVFFFFILFEATKLRKKIREVQKWSTKLKKRLSSHRERHIQLIFSPTLSHTLK